MIQIYTNGDTIITADIDGIDYTHVATSITIHADGTMTVLNEQMINLGKELE